MTRFRSVAVLGVVALCVLAGCSGLTGSQPTTATDSTVSPRHQSPTPDPTPTTTVPVSAGPTDSEMPTSTATATPTTTASATPTPTATPSEVGRVVVEGGSLPVNATRVYRQLQSMLGTDVEPPTVRVTDEMPTLERYERSLTSQFTRTFGFGTDFINTSVYHGYTNSRGVVVMLNGATGPEVETLLAHEFAHWLQLHSDVLDANGFRRFVTDRDSNAVARGLMEGGAVFITDEYVERYMDIPWNQTEALGHQYSRGPPARRVFRAPYYFGSLYLHDVIDRPSNLSWAYNSSNPVPETTEQLLHGLVPAREPELALSVSANATGEWALHGGSAHYAVTSRGELAVRTMLRVELNRSVAARAAEGWGTDRVVRFDYRRNRTETGFAWVVRWDSAEDADEFQRAFDSWLAAHEDTPETAFDLRRLDSETVVVFAGDPAFVSNATASGGGDSVTVGVTD